jgi:small subunit ribosomal protein S8
MNPIANFLIKLKNASRVNHETVAFPYSKFIHAIASCLLRAGYIAGFEKKHKKAGEEIVVTLKYTDNGPRINDVTLISKPSARRYFGVSDIHPVKNGFGVMVLSTPKGVMTDSEAKKELVGGEALFKMW